MSTGNKKINPDKVRNEIKNRAYEIYKKDGGTAEDNWLKAEREIYVKYGITHEDMRNADSDYIEHLS